MAHTSFASRLMHDVTEYFTPVLRSTRFVDEGVLTPEEFVAAGDLLTRVSPLWKWVSGEAASRKTYLPAEKQFLLLRGASCAERAAAHESVLTGGGVAEEEVDGGWLSAYGRPEDDDADGTVFLSTEASSLSSLIRDDYVPAESASVSAAAPDAASSRPVAATHGVPAAGTSGHVAAAAADDDDDEYLDLETFEGVAGADEAALPPSAPAVASSGAGGAPSTVASSDRFVRRRTYDLSIVYDGKYRTPRVYLFGYDEDSRPLTPTQVMEDVHPDYANKTVTVEPHPHEPSKPVHASIHPCRHAAAMKRIVDSLIDSGLSREQVERRVETYILIFIKFIQSVVPTIDCDSTVDVDVAASSGSSSA